MKFNFELKDVIIVILILLLGYFGFQYIRNGGIEKKYEQEVKLREALEDSVTYFQTEQGDWVAEKRTLQGDLKDLEDQKDRLSEDQKALLSTISKLNKEWNKEREVFAAAQINYQSLIDSLNVVIASASDVDTLNNVVSFAQTDTASHFIYDLDVLGVRPFPETTLPNLRFNKIDFPNTQTVTFNFDENKRKDYPISFSVINTNPYYRASNIESYAIEGLTKENINPTGWNKIWNWVKINGKYVLVGAAGYAIGSSVSK